MLIGPANQHDSRMLAPTLDAIPAIRNGKRGRPRRRPDRLHADKGYDYQRCRQECRIRGVRPRIARRGVDNSQRLGRHRWVVERTHAWLNRFRRLSVRYERRADIFLAFNILGCALVCLNQSQTVLLGALRSPASILPGSVSAAFPEYRWSRNRSPAWRDNHAGQPILHIRPQRHVTRQLCWLRTPGSLFGMPLRRGGSIVQAAAARRGVASQLSRDR